MLSPTEKTLLKELLALLPVPEQSLTYNELMGFMFGLAITPVHIPAEEWMVAIFADDDSGITAMDQARSMATVLGQVYETFMGGKARGELHFPYQLEVLDHCDLEEVLEWVSGFEEALALRPEIWEPEDEAQAPGNIDEIYFSLMVIQGLADQEDIMPFFEQLPDEVLAQAFSVYEPSEENRELQIQAFLLATLPLAVKTLQSYADEVARTVPAAKRPGSAASLGRKGFAAPSEKEPRSARRDNIIEVDFAAKKKKPQPKADAALYQLKISLTNARPPIWRRLLVPGFATLADLHRIIQASMGWSDAHLHEFRIGTTVYGPSGESDDNDGSVQDEESQTLHLLAGRLGPHFDYIYDFGDNWHHRIELEKILAPEESHPCPLLVKGKGACPPEDIGGMGRYRELLSDREDSDSEDRDPLTELAGPDFSPERFDHEDITRINETLKDILR